MTTNQNRRAELMPCPFCGGDAEIDRIGSARESMIVACSDCGATVESGDVVGLTRDYAWNRRATPPTAGGEWVMVPATEMPDAMMDAGRAYLDAQSPNGRHWLSGTFNWHEFWAAMLAASPAPPAADAGWHTFADRPATGRKFITLHNDGSGASMFFAIDGGVIDSDGDEYYGWNPDNTAYDRWAYLPDNLEFWCEVRSEDPMTLRSLPAPPCEATTPQLPAPDVAEEPYPDPTPEMLNGDILFDTIWAAIKGWDISRNCDGVYSGATGNDARRIYDAVTLNIIEWAVSRWKAEVKNRPLQNIHRRTIDDTWRQVIRHFGGDAVALCGPAHDELLDARASGIEPKIGGE